jgi:hypothetical protein
MLDLRPGATPEWELSLFADDEELVPFDCTGATLSVVGTELGFTPAIAWIDRAAGTALLGMTAEQTSGLQRRRRYHFAIKVELASGHIEITPDVAVRVT